MFPAWLSFQLLSEAFERSAPDWILRNSAHCSYELPAHRDEFHFGSFLPSFHPRLLILLLQQLFLTSWSLLLCWECSVPYQKSLNPDCSHLGNWVYLIRTVWSCIFPLSHLIQKIEHINFMQGMANQMMTYLKTCYNFDAAFVCLDKLWTAHNCKKNNLFSSTCDSGGRVSKAGVL